MTTKLSVIIPTHNRAHLLGRALDSVFGQTRPADEVVVVDDGSTDTTPTLLHERFPSVRRLYQDNAGVAAARNHGIHHATGDWLAFLDSDDVWHPRKLESQLQDLNRHPDVSIAYTDEIWIRRGKRVNAMKKHAKTDGHIYRQCLPLCIISPSSVIIRRGVFDAIGLFDTTLPACEDYDLWLRITARFPVRFLAEPLITKYGGHADQLSQRYWGMDRFRIVALEKMLADKALQHGDRLATLVMLVEKLTILGQGARKRGKLEEAERYTRKQHRYAALLETRETPA